MGRDDFLKTTQSYWSKVGLPAPILKNDLKTTARDWLEPCQTPTPPGETSYCPHYTSPTSTPRRVNTARCGATKQHDVAPLLRGPGPSCWRRTRSATPIFTRSGAEVLNATAVDLVWRSESIDETLCPIVGCWASFKLMEKQGEGGEISHESYRESATPGKKSAPALVTLSAHRCVPPCPGKSSHQHSRSM